MGYTDICPKGPTNNTPVLVQIIIGVEQATSYHLNNGSLVIDSCIRHLAPMSYVWASADKVRHVMPHGWLSSNLNIPSVT